MEKQIDRITEIIDIKGFFPKCQVSAYLENCCLVTFLEESEISVSTIDFWKCNGFELVGFGVNDINKLTATFRLDQRRINRGITKQITVSQMNRDLQ